MSLPRNALGGRRLFSAELRRRESDAPAWPGRSLCCLLQTHAGPEVTGKFPSEPVQRRT